jgi:cytochrome d ubiquinol oxidase subunit I
VSGILKTSDAATSIAAGNVGLSLLLYSVVYVVLLLAYIQTLFYMARKSVEVKEFDISEGVGSIQEQQHWQKSGGDEPQSLTGGAA